MKRFEIFWNVYTFQKIFEKKNWNVSRFKFWKKTFQILKKRFKFENNVSKFYETFQNFTWRFKFGREENFVQNCQNYPQNYLLWSKAAVYKSSEHVMLSLRLLVINMHETSDFVPKNLLNHNTQHKITNSRGINFYFMWQASI